MSFQAVDCFKVKEAGESSEAYSPTEEEVRADPRAVLAKFGVAIDEEMNATILERLKAPAAAQASIIHADG